MNTTLYALLVKLQVLLIALASSTATATIPPNGQNLSYAASSTIMAYVDARAVSYGINPELVNCIIGRESQWVINKTGPEKKGHSEGLWQIYSLAHPEITKAQADDPIFSTEWSLNQIEKGNVKIWTTYKDFCQSLPVFSP